MRSIRGKAEEDGSDKILQIDFAGMAVFVAMPTHRDLHPATVHSLLETQRIVRTYDIPLAILFETGSSVVEVARSFCVYRFLESEATKLFFIDSDMQWEADGFMRMLAISTKVKAACASYPAKSHPLQFHLNLPTNVSVNEYGCIPVESGALGFSVIDREIIEKLARRAPKRKFRFGDFDGKTVRHLFHTGVKDGYLVSEDISFFHDVSALGYDIWCDPTIKLGHIGAYVYVGSLLEHTLETMKQEAAE